MASHCCNISPWLGQELVLGLQLCAVRRSCAAKLWVFHVFGQAPMANLGIPAMVMLRLVQINLFLKVPTLGYAQSRAGLSATEEPQNLVFVKRALATQLL